MAHFAELDADNKVLRVIVVDNADCLKNGEEDEATGIAFCEQLCGGTWVQTSYNNRIRKRYAGTGHTYDTDRDAFIIPQPYLSWTLDEEGDWQPPTPYPDDDKVYSWDEEEKEWIER